MKNATVVVDDIAALRKVGTRSTRRLYVVRSTSDMYLLDPDSTAEDDGRLVIEPEHQNGRFLLCTSGQPVQDEGQYAQNILRLAGVGKHGETVTIGDDVYYLTTKDDASVAVEGQIAIDLHGGATVKAQGKYTVAGGDAADTETLVINGKTYTLQTVLTNVDGNVLIGATPEDTIDNMVAAINGGAGAGTKYAAATTVHTTVTASKSSTDKLIITAIIGGTAGNAYTLAGTAAHWTRDAATLGTTTLGVDPSAANVCDGLVAAINASGTEEVTARKISNNELQIIADAKGVVTIACAETLATANNTWSAAAMYGGKAEAERLFAAASRVPTATEVAVAMHFEFDFTPSIVIPHVKVTTGGARKIWGGTIGISNGHVTLTNNGTTDFATTDTVEVLAWQ